MDSNNTSLKTTTNEINTSSLDLRDVINFLLSKIWIIVLVVLCFAIVAFLWTDLFVDPQYTSTTDMFIISTSGTTMENQTASNQVNNWSIG